MKILYTALLSLVILWSPAIFAKYCKYNDAGRVRSCEFKVTGLKNNSQIIISYTQQGWSLMAVIYIDEFVLVEGDARIKIGKNEPRTLEYVKTSRDVSGGKMVEAAVFLTSEDVLHEIANSSRAIRIYLPAAEAEDQVIKANDSRFDGLEDYIAETKAAVGL